MPVFWILLVLALALFWLLSAFAFKPIGKFCKKLWKDAKDAMNEDDEKEEKEI